MKVLNKSLVLILSVFTIQYCYSQQNENIWRETAFDRVLEVKGERPIKPIEFQLYQLDFELLKSELDKAPEELNTNQGIKITVPSPQGLKGFVILKTNILPKALQAPDADIQTFFGFNESNPNEWISLDYTNHGFHAMVSGVENESYYIDPYQLNDTENYLVYYSKDHKRETAFECLVKDTHVTGDLNINDIEFHQYQNRSAIETDCKLRTYRLAIACSAEYTAYHGGTQALAQSGIVTTINRVNQVFKRDLGIQLTIVSGTNVIYLDPNTDPYLNGDIYQMLDTNSNVMPDMVGEANFDIGHVLGTAGLLSGGLATRDGTCQSGDKSGGVTTLEDPIGDQFDIDFVAHELAHQLGGRHTFNSNIGACGGWLQRSDVGAFEPGSGSSIMAYAGLCNQPGLSADVQDYSDAVFHSYTIYEISKSVITGNSSECGTVSSSGNSKPIADAGPVYYNIPANTPFELTGNSTDIDATDIHTYSWEQYDLAPTPQNLPVSTSLNQPNFRMFEPNLNKTRYFPNLDSLVVNNNSPRFEKLPSVTRSMKFRLTVRDNSSSGCGCTDYDEVDVNFDGTKGPFLVTYPNVNGISWNATSSQTVTWDVAGTDSAPVSCSNVDVMLSVDGGFTYPHVLALNVPNDGNQIITVPNLGTSTARVKIICSDNIFFDISDQNFTIIPIPVTEPEISFESSILETFEKNQPDGYLDCRPYKDYTITMLIANPPLGNAVVSVNTGGNATNLYDYEIIGAPITFIDGGVNNQSFIVRIIDDGVVDPLENLELSFSISGNTNAIHGDNNQTCLVKINDDEHAPFSGATPHYEENFDSGVTFGSANNNWNDGSNSGDEVWVYGPDGDISGSGNSLYISDNGTGNSYNTSNGYNYVSVQSAEINGFGKSNQVLTFDYVSEGDVGHDFGRLMYGLGNSTSLIEGGNNAPFVGVTEKKTAQILLPSNLDDNNYRLAWGWSNYSTNPAGISGKGFEIDNIRVTEGTPGIRIESDIMTIADEQYLGPNQSIYFYSPNDGNLILHIQNTSNHDYGCTTVEVNRDGKTSAEFQFVDQVLNVTDKTYKVIPSNNNPNGTYNITLYYSEDEIAGWEASTGNDRMGLEIVKTIGNISTVTPTNPQAATTFYKPANLGTFGNDITLTASFNNGFSGFAAGIKPIILPVEIVNFNVKNINNDFAQINWATASEINNDFFTIERSKDGINWNEFTNVDGAGNSSEYLEYNLNDRSPYLGISYYRLKQTDFDGQVKYHKIVSVNFEQNEIIIYPNITHESFILQGEKDEISVTKVYNTAGKDVTSLLIFENQSDEIIKVNISMLAAGMYYIKTKTTVSKICKL